MEESAPISAVRRCTMNELPAACYVRSCGRRSGRPFPVARRAAPATAASLHARTQSPTDA